MDSTMRGLLIILTVFLIVALGFSALMGGMMGTGLLGPGGAAQGPFGPVTMHGWMWGLGMGLGGLVMLAFWGALIVGGFLLVRSLGAPAAPPHATPLDVLKRRYAAGEITREQYDQMRRDLEA